MLLSKVFSALGDERRLKVIAALRTGGVLTKTEIAKAIHWDGSHTASEYACRRAIDALVEAGIIEEIGSDPVRCVLMEDVIADAAKRLGGFDL